MDHSSLWVYGWALPLFHSVLYDTSMLVIEYSWNRLVWM